METRRVIGIMWVVWTVLASLLLPGHTLATVRALVGEDVLLPCVCPPSHPGKHYLVWQIGQHTNVDYAIAGEDQAIRALQYQNRTRLFHPADNGNCSLLLRRVRLADAKTYSCHYDHIVNVTVTLEVAVNYSLQCSNDRSGEQYRCSANGGFPKGRIYWLQDGQAVEKLQGPLSELHSQDHLTGLYNITSTLRTGPKTATLQCVVENPSLPHNITADCRGEGHKELLVELKASLAVGSALLLLLATVCLTFLLRFWKPCPSTKAPVLYEAAPVAEV